MTPGCRRAWLAGCAAAAAALAGWPPSRAGTQAEEPLADAVRTALSAAIASAAPPRLSFASTDQRLAFLQWQGTMSERLKRHKTEAHRAGLEPALVLGLIQVESGFRKYAISSAGARGYMQVMPFWARVIGDGDAARLFHLQTNLRFGCVILRHYLDVERGNLFLALGRYNGSRGKAPYPDAVLANRTRWLS